MKDEYDATLSCISNTFIEDEDGTTRFLATILSHSEDDEINKINSAVRGAFLGCLTKLTAILDSGADHTVDDTELFPWIEGMGQADLSFVRGDIYIVLENKIARESIRSGQLAKLWQGTKLCLKRDDFPSRGFLVFLVPTEGVGQSEISRIPDEDEGSVQKISWTEVLSEIDRILSEELEGVVHPWKTWIVNSTRRIRGLLEYNAKKKKDYPDWELKIKDATKEIVRRTTERAVTMGFGDELVMTTSGGVEGMEERYARFANNPGRGVYLYVLHASDVVDDSEWNLQTKLTFNINKNAKSKLGARYEDLVSGWNDFLHLYNHSRPEVRPFLKKLSFTSTSASREFTYGPCSRDEAIEKVVNDTLRMLDQFRAVLALTGDTA